MWLLTGDAVRDLDLMAVWGAQTFGYRQSEAYESRIVRMLDALAANPQMASERRAATQTVRLMPCEAHNILYLVRDGGDIVVLRILHHLQDWFELL